MIDNLRDREYSPSQVTFHQDLDYVMNKSIHAYTFKESKDSSLLYGESLELQTEKYEKSNQKNTLIVGCTMLIVALSAFGILSLFDLDNNTIPQLIAIATAFVAGGVVSFVINNKDDVFTLKLNSFNCMFYQLRVLADNRWCIICGANFNHENKVLDNNFIAEVAPTYSDLIIMDDVDCIEETDDGIVIHANATIRKYEPEKPYNKYMEMDGKLLMDIDIQHGVYPESMLSEIAEETI